MTFDLKEKYIEVGALGEPSIIYLPSGACEVWINQAGKQPNSFFCYVFGMITGASLMLAFWACTRVGVFGNTWDHFPVPRQIIFSGVPQIH